MVDSDAGREALSAIDAALRARPDKPGDVLSHATQSLCTLREEMIAAARHEGAASGRRERLERVNAIISVVLAVYFPLGDVPWWELEKARCWLADIVGVTG